MKKILVIGSLNADLNIRVPHIPGRGETVLAGALSRNCGGKGANQAYAAAKLGGEVAMLGAVGDDGEGKMLKNALASVGIDTGRLLVGSEPTGLAVVTVDDGGDNAITVVQGANAEVSVGYIEKNCDMIEKCDIIIMQLEIPVDTVLYAARLAHTLGKTVIFDPAPAQKSLPAELFGYIDFIKPNETELHILSGGKYGAEKTENAARELLDMGVKNVIVSLGGDGCYFCDRDGGQKLSAVKVNAVDSTAAGDCFVAAFAVKLAEGADVRAAVNFAQRAAAISVTRRGAQSSIPDRKEIEI